MSTIRSSNKMFKSLNLLAEKSLIIFLNKTGNVDAYLCIIIYTCLDT